MNKKKCEVCGSSHTVKNGVRKGVQLYKCQDCGHTIGHKRLHKDGKMHYTHQRLRAAMNSLNFYLPYLFTYQRKDCKGMPNTNNKIEGTFTDLKKNLNNHSGLTKENRKRFISGFFLALAESLSMEKQEPR